MCNSAYYVYIVCGYRVWSDMDENLSFNMPPRQLFYVYVSYIHTSKESIDIYLEYDDERH